MNFGNNFSKCRYAIYLHGVPQRMSNSRCVTCRTLRMIAHSLMVHARVLEAYIHFLLMYTEDHIFPVLPIKDLINEDGKPTTPYKLVTGMKLSISNLCVLFFPCAVRKATAHVETKAWLACCLCLSGL